MTKDLIARTVWSIFLDSHVNLCGLEVHIEDSDTIRLVLVSENFIGDNLTHRLDYCFAILKNYTDYLSALDYCVVVNPLTYKELHEEVSQTVSERV